MQLTGALSLAFAAVAAASPNAPYQFERRQYSNSSASVDAAAVTPSQFTTSTVYATQLHTITSCAPEVTNCPARSGTPAVVTSIVAISTTVCPVTATETPAAGTPSLSSAVEGGAENPYATPSPSSTVDGGAQAPYPTPSAPVSAESVPSVPLGTGASAPSPSSDVQAETAPAGETPTVVTKTSDSTLTYTLGTGSSTTVVTTTIKHTSTETLYSVSLIGFVSNFMRMN